MRRPLGHPPSGRRRTHGRANSSIRLESHHWRLSASAAHARRPGSRRCPPLRRLRPTPAPARNSRTCAPATACPRPTGSSSASFEALKYEHLYHKELSDGADVASAIAWYLKPLQRRAPPRGTRLRDPAQRLAGHRRPTALRRQPLDGRICPDSLTRDSGDKRLRPCGQRSTFAAGCSSRR